MENNNNRKRERVMSTVVVKRYGRHVNGRPKRRKDLTLLENLKATISEIKEYLRDRNIAEIREVVDNGMYWYDPEEDQKEQENKNSKTR